MVCLPSEGNDFEERTTLIYIYLYKTYSAIFLFLLWAWHVNSLCTDVPLLQMEREFHFGNVSISLVLMLFLRALTGTSPTLSFTSGREPQTAAALGSHRAGEDGNEGVLVERGLESIGGPLPGVIGDVTVEDHDDESGATGNGEESYGESDGNIRPKR